MGKPRSKRRARPPRDDATAAPPPATATAAQPSSGKAWRFILTFAVLIAIFYGVYHFPYPADSTPERLSIGYLSAYAWLAGSTLGVLGEDVRIDGQDIHGRYNLRIVRGCDAVEGKALFIAAVLAFPVAWRRRLLGVVVGLIALVLLNLVRITSLYYVGIHWPSLFDRMHMEVWQGVFVVAAVALWLAWALWATRRRPGPATDAQS